MSKHNDTDKKLVGATLRAFGYNIEELAERPELSIQTCDLRAGHPSGTILIEVKTFQPGDAERRELAATQRVNIERNVARSSGMHSVLHYSAKQLRATDTGGALRIVWSRVVGAGESSRSLQLYCTLFGIRWFSIDGYCTPCFLADGSWFRTHPDIDAEITQTPSGIGMRINPFAPTTAALRATRLFQVLAGLGAVLDLHSHAKQLGIVLADVGTANPSTEEVVSHLYKAYGVTARVLPADFNKAWSTTSPGSEMGGMPIVPGADIQVSELQLAIVLEQIRAADARALSTPSV